MKRGLDHLCLQPWMDKVYSTPGTFPPWLRNGNHWNMTRLLCKKKLVTIGFGEIHFPLNHGDVGGRLTSFSVIGIFDRNVSSAFTRVSKFKVQHQIQSSVTKFPYDFFKKPLSFFFLVGTFCYESTKRTKQLFSTM